MADGMEAAMCSCDFDAPSPEFYNETYHKAAKEHCCDECGDKIEVGERYQYISGKWDGDFMTFKTCEICARIRDDYCAPLTMLNEYLREYLGVGLNEVPDED